jgi:uncharacterized protein YuzB (UPF0349 family)
MIERADVFEIWRIPSATERSCENAMINFFCLTWKKMCVVSEESQSLVVGEVVESEGQLLEVEG